MDVSLVNVVVRVDLLCRRQKVVSLICFTKYIIIYNLQENELIIATLEKKTGCHVPWLSQNITVSKQPRVLKKFLNRWRIFGSRWRLDMPLYFPDCRRNMGGGFRGPPPENFEILDGRRCNLGIYLRKMKLLIGVRNAGFCRVNFCSSRREIEEIQAIVKMPQN